MRLIFYPCIEIFLWFLESQISLLVFVGASFVFKLKLPGAGNICNNWFEFHAQKCRQIIVNGHSYQWQVDTYHAHQRNQEWRHYIASSDFESGHPMTNFLIELDDNRPLELGQWASLIWNWEEGKKHSERQHGTEKTGITTFWQQWKWKNEEHSSSFQIGLFVFCGPLPAILLEEGFFTELQVQIGHLQCNLTKPQVKICFQNAFMPLRFVVLCNSCHLHSIWAKLKGFAGDCAWKHSGLECLHCKCAPTSYPCTTLDFPRKLKNLFMSRNLFRKEKECSRCQEWNSSTVTFQTRPTWESS